MAVVLAVAVADEVVLVPVTSAVDANSCTAV